jgi:hypothetical protein
MSVWCVRVIISVPCVCVCSRVSVGQSVGDVVGRSESIIDQALAGQSSMGSAVFLLLYICSTVLLVRVIDN